MDPFLYKPPLLFTKYENIIPMKQSEMMIFECPKATTLYRKILYIKKDRGEQGLRTAYIMPYLDDRKIILNIPKQKNSRIMWSLIEEEEISDNHQSKIQSMYKQQSELAKNFQQKKVTEVQSQQDIMSKSGIKVINLQQDIQVPQMNAESAGQGPSISIEEEYKEDEQENSRDAIMSRLVLVKNQNLSDLSSNTNQQEENQSFWKKFKCKGQSKIGVDIIEKKQSSQFTKWQDFSSQKMRIMSINIQQSKIQVYSLQGQLLRVQDFFPVQKNSLKQMPHQAQPVNQLSQRTQIKDPIALSQNGTVMVFRGSDDDSSLMRLQVQDIHLHRGFTEIGPNTWEVDLEQVISKNSKALSLLLPNYEVMPQRSNHLKPDLEGQFIAQNPKHRSQQSIDTLKNNFQTENINDVVRDPSEIVDNIIPENREINQDLQLENEPEIEQSPAKNELQTEIPGIATQILGQYQMKVEVNNNGDLCVLFIDKKQALIKQFFQELIDQQSSNLQNEEFSNEQKKINQPEHSKKTKLLKNTMRQAEIIDPIDKKIRVFVVIKKPQCLDQRFGGAGIMDQRNTSKGGDKKNVVYDNKNLEVIIFSNLQEFNHAKLIKNFAISRENIFFWNVSSVYYCAFTGPNFTQRKDRNGNLRVKVKQIAFSIPFGEAIKRNFIEDVSVSDEGSTDQTIVIKMALNQKLNTLIVWDLKDNTERDSYDVSSQAQVMFDQQGDLYVLEHDHIIINHSGGRNFSYQIEPQYLDFEEKTKIQKQQLNLEKYDKGNKVDHRGNNYLIIKNKLHISQSYLGILINEYNSLIDYSERIFDQGAYPYYINKNSEIHHLLQDPNSLEQLFNYYEETDNRLLDHILLIDHAGQTPLHLATENEMTKSLNLLLKKLSIVRVNNTFNFKDIFDNLLDFCFFQEYLNVCYFQTLQMKSLQSMNIPRNSDNDEEKFVIVKQNNNTFMSQELIDSVQSEEYPSLPVKVKGFDLYWILNTQHGTNFLHKLSQHNNVNFFMTEFIKTLIYFLWSHYKIKIIIWVMLPFIVYFGLFIALVFYNENYFHKENMIFEGHENRNMLGIAITTLVFISYFFYLWLRKVLTLGVLSIRSFWVWFNFISNSLNLVIVSMIINKNDPYQIRRLESFAVTFMYFRFLYFFRILDQTAPLIRMIWQIVYDMRSFIFIFILIILAFANGFYILAQNQLNQTSNDEIPYLSFRLAIIHVYKSSIGDYDTDSYVEGDEENILWTFFIFTTFFLTIVLLNMLIAMMGQSYQRVSDVSEASMLRERLLMIMENFFLSNQQAFKEAKYLISFSPLQEEDSQEALLDQMMSKINNLSKEVKAEMQNLKDLQIQHQAQNLAPFSEPTYNNYSSQAQMQPQLMKNASTNQ